MVSVQGLFIFMSCGMAIAFPSVYYTPQNNVCSGNVVENSYGTEQQECPQPPFYGGSLSSYRPTQVDEPAIIENLGMDWFLTSKGDPAVNVTISAVSPNSAQEYTLNVMADFFLMPIYCGKISTNAPVDGTQSQKQIISVEVQCLPKSLGPERRVTVAVEVQGSSQPITSTSRLPGCEDKMMRNSNQCIEERRQRISFSLKQLGNSTTVILNTKTAYLKPNPSSKVYAAIAKRDEKAFRKWAPVGSEKTLTFPQRITTFTDLEIGATYQVSVWRPESPGKRYTDVITLKPDRKAEYGTETLMKRLYRKSILRNW